MIDFVTTKKDVMILRNNIPVYYFEKKAMIEDSETVLLKVLNAQLESQGDYKLNLVEYEEFVNLRQNLIEIENNLLE